MGKEVQLEYPKRKIVFIATWAAIDSPNSYEHT